MHTHTHTWSPKSQDPQVESWLNQQGFSQPILTFLKRHLAENLIDMPALLDLTEESMTELGIPFGAKKALAKALQK